MAVYLESNGRAKVSGMDESKKLCDTLLKLIQRKVSAHGEKLTGEELGLLLQATSNLLEAYRVIDASRQQS